MFDLSELITCSSDIVGYRQSASSDHTTLTPALTTSTSGYYVTDLPGVDFGIITAVLEDSYTDMNTYLSQVRETAAIDIVERIINKAKDKLNTKEVLCNTPFSNSVGDFSKLITQNAGFVGYLVSPRKSNSIKGVISELGVQLDTIQSDPLRIYLYDTSQNTAIQTFDITNTVTKSLEWFAVTDWIVDYISKDKGVGNNYLVGYYENDPNNVQTFQLEGQAIKTEFDCNCGGSAKKSWNSFMGIEPIEIPNSALVFNGTDYDLPDVDKISFTTTGYGLNAKINVKCDITEIICANIPLIGKAVQLACGIRILKDGMATTRINSESDAKRKQNENFAREYEDQLNGFITTSGARQRGIVENLVFDLSGVDTVCLPPQKRFPTTGNISR